MKKYLLFFFTLLFIAAPLCADEAENHILKGGQYVQAKDFKKAVKEYEAALSVDPKNTKANLLLGLTYAALEDLDNAIRYSSKAVELQPSYISYSNLGLVYAYRTDYDKAAQNYEKALEINPKSFQGWYQLGKVYFTEGNFSKAIKAYDEAVQLNPKFGEAYQGLGSAYYWSGDKGSAVKQVAEMKRMKLNEKAEQLQNWINDKEAKKNQTAPPAVPAPKN